MPIFLGHTTAECILNSPDAPHFERSSEVPAYTGFVDDEVLSSLDLSAFELPENAPLDIVVSAREKRRYRKGLRCHVSSGDLPYGAYLQIASDVFVASPALCLLQQAPSLTLAGRIKLAARFCGTYAPSKKDSRGFITRMPLATPDNLRDFAELCPRTRGVQQVLEAIDWTLPNAASPMETEMVMPFYLPQEWGGFGLPKPTMNYEVTLNARARAMTGTTKAYIDAYWEEHSFGFEYQSKLKHDFEEKYGEDIGRQLAVESMGRTIRMVTLEQLKNAAQLEYLAGLVASHIGVDFDAECGKSLRDALVRDILSD